MAADTTTPSRVDADDWDAHWDAYAESAEDNPAQAYRHRLTLALLGDAGPPTRLLDIGSGQGDLIRAAHARWPGAELLGLELSASGVATGRAKVPAASFLQRNLLDGAEPETEHRGWATHAVCSEVLEHLDDPLRFLRAARPYLAPDCRFVVTVPGGPRSAFDRHIGHRRHYRVEELRALLTTGGFEVEDVRAAGFPAFNLYKLVVIARGERLARDVGDGESGNASTLARVVMAGFGPLFRFAARDHSRWGWQLLAVARPS